MRRNTEKESGAPKKKDISLIISILAYVCILLVRIPLVYIIGEKGLAYFSVANEIFWVMVCFFAGGLSEAVMMLVRYRTRREQYKNADKVVHGALFIVLVLGGILSIFFLLFGQNFVENVIKVPLSGLAVMMMAPALILKFITEILKGFFKGNGSRVPAMHSQILEVILLISGAILGAGMFYKYGMKVSALLQVADYAGAYGAMGACIGLLAASALCCMHMLILYVLYSRYAKKRKGNDPFKSQEGGQRTIHILVGTTIPYALLLGVGQVLPIFDFAFWMRWSGDVNAVLTWGNYYGKYLVIIGVLVALLYLAGIEPMKRTAHFIDKDDIRTARDKWKVLMHQNAIATIPAAMFTAVFAENILNVLFKGNNSKEAEWLMCGSILIIIYVFAALAAGVLIYARKMKYVVCYEVPAVIVHLVVTALLLQYTKLGILAIVLGSILFGMIMMCMGHFLIAKMVQYSPDWIRCFAITIVVAAVAGLIGMLLNKVFMPVIGSTISLVICLPVSIVAYLILLLVSRGVNAEELNEMSGGGALIWIAKKLHFM